MSQDLFLSEHQVKRQSCCRLSWVLFHEDGHDQSCCGASGSLGVAPRAPQKETYPAHPSWSQGLHRPQGGGLRQKPWAGGFLLLVMMRLEDNFNILGLLYAVCPLPLYSTSVLVLDFHAKKPCCAVLW